MYTSELPVWAQILLEEGSQCAGTMGGANEADLQTCLVLLAHGSRDPRWREPFERIYLHMRRELGDSVKIAYMEFVEPTVFDVAEECVRDSFQKMKILPLFMAAGAHLATDVPEQAEDCENAIRYLRLRSCRPLGKTPGCSS
jgi:sirohydrochlorin cobaltochelatase